MLIRGASSARASPQPVCLSVVPEVDLQGRAPRVTESHQRQRALATGELPHRPRCPTTDTEQGSGPGSLFFYVIAPTTGDRQRGYLQMMGETRPANRQANP